MKMLKQTRKNIMHYGIIRYDHAIFTDIYTMDSEMLLIFNATQLEVKAHQCVILNTIAVILINMSE